MNLLCKWGLFDRTEPINKAILCEKCSGELYDKCRGAINSLLMFWANTESNEKCEICSSGKTVDEKDIINFYKL